MQHDLVKHLKRGYNHLTDVLCTWWFVIKKYRQKIFQYLRNSFCKHIARYLNPLFPHFYAYLLLFYNLYYLSQKRNWQNGRIFYRNFWDNGKIGILQHEILICF